MRYVIADLDGRSQAYFDRRGEAREALREMEDDEPGSIDDLYLVAYDGGERIWGPASARDVLESLELDWSDQAPSAPPMTGTAAYTEGPTTDLLETHQSAGVDTEPPAVPA